MYNLFFSIFFTITLVYSQYFLKTIHSCLFIFTILPVSVTIMAVNYRIKKEEFNIQNILCGILFSTLHTILIYFGLNLLFCNTFVLFISCISISLIFYIFFKSDFCFSHILLLALSTMLLSVIIQTEEFENTGMLIDGIEALTLPVLNRFGLVFVGTLAGRLMIPLSFNWFIVGLLMFIFGIGSVLYDFDILKGEIQVVEKHTLTYVIYIVLIMLSFIYYTKMNVDIKFGRVLNIMFILAHSCFFIPIIDFVFVKTLLEKKMWFLYFTFLLCHLICFYMINCDFIESFIGNMVNNLRGFRRNRENENNRNQDVAANENNPENITENQGGNNQ